MRTHPEFLYHPVYQAVSEISGDHDSGQFLQFLHRLLGIDACTGIRIHQWRRLVVLLVGIVAVMPDVTIVTILRHCKVYLFVAADEEIFGSFIFCVFKPFTAQSDQYLNSRYDFKTLLSRRVMIIK